MKKEDVTLKDCKFTLTYSENFGLDGCIIDVKVTELSQIQRLVAKFGGRVDLFNASLEIPGQEPEIMTWVNYHYTNEITFFASLNISADQYHLMLAGFQGNNSIYFEKPQVMTMIDNLYLVFPEDRSKIRAEYRESQASAFGITKD